MKNSHAIHWLGWHRIEVETPYSMKKDRLQRQLFPQARMRVTASRVAQESDR